MKRRATACYVARETATGQVGGYYTIAAADIPLSDIPEALVKRLPRYPLVPIARMGRLAVDHAHRGKQLGSALVWDAALRLSGPNWPWWRSRSMPRTTRLKPSTCITVSSASVAGRGSCSSSWPMSPCRRGGRRKLEVGRPGKESCGREVDAIAEVAEAALLELVAGFGRPAS